MLALGNDSVEGRQWWSEQYVVRLFSNYIEPRWIPRVPRLRKPRAASQIGVHFSYSGATQTVTLAVTCETRSPTSAEKHVRSAPAQSYSWKIIPLHG